MLLKRWTGVLQVQPCLEIIDYLFSEWSISVLNLIVFVTARDIHGFLTLSSRSRIHENAIEIAFNLKEDFMERRKVFDRLWIIKITYLIQEGLISNRGYYQEPDLPHIQISFQSSHIFISQQPSTFS